MTTIKNIRKKLRNKISLDKNIAKRLIKISEENNKFQKLVMNFTGTG